MRWQKTISNNSISSCNCNAIWTVSAESSLACSSVLFKCVVNVRYNSWYRNDWKKRAHDGGLHLQVQINGSSSTSHQSRFKLKPTHMPIGYFIGSNTDWLHLVIVDSIINWFQSCFFLAQHFNNKTHNFTHFPALSIAMWFFFC